MKTLSIERYLNKKKFALFVILFVALLICFGFFSDLFYFIFQFDTNAPDLAGRGEEVRNNLMRGRMNIHSFMNTEICTRYILPLITFTFSIFFFQEKKSISLYKYSRQQSRVKVVLSAIFSHSFFAAIVLFAVYMVYLSIGWICMDITPSQLPMSQFDGVFGSGWGYNNNYLFYTLCGVYRVFLYSFVYVLFSCSIGLIVKKAYLAIIWSSVYYYGVSLVCEILPLNHELKRILSPEMVHCFTSYVYDPVNVYDAFAPMMSLVPPLVVSIVLIVYTFTRSEKVEY